jgi:hypothetical protein
MNKSVQSLIVILLLLVCSCGPPPNPVADIQNACGARSKVPSNDQLDQMSAKSLWMLAENAKIQGEIVAMESAMGRAVDPCDKEFAINELRFRELARAKTSIEKTQLQIDALRAKAKR